MATNNRSTRRRNTNTARNIRNTRGTYVDGNTVRKLSEVPQRPAPPRRPPAQRQVQTQAKPKQQRNAVRAKEIQRNREKALGMNFAFVVFLVVVCTAILFCCINFIQLKSEITASMKTVAALESELTQLKEDNDAYYSQVTSNVDLDKIKKIAIGRLGMKYPSEDQTMEYTTEGKSYVRQYQDIPDLK